MATTCFQAVQAVGFPEARIIMSEAAIYLATSAKSNSAYMAINEAQQLVRKTGNLSVPLPIRNAPTKLMKSLGYGKSYKYSHNYDGNFEQQDYLPEEVKGTVLYDPGANKSEQIVRQRLEKWWREHYKY